MAERPPILQLITCKCQQQDCDATVTQPPRRYCAAHQRYTPPNSDRTDMRRAQVRENVARYRRRRRSRAAQNDERAYGMRRILRWVARHIRLSTPLFIVTIVRLDNDSFLILPSDYQSTLGGDWEGPLTSTTRRDPSTPLEPIDHFEEQCDLIFFRHNATEAVLQFTWHSAPDACPPLARWRSILLDTVPRLVAEILRNIAPNTAPSRRSTTSDVRRSLKETIESDLIFEDMRHLEYDRASFALVAPDETTAPDPDPAVLILLGRTSQ